MGLERIGVEAVVENLPGFNRAITQVNRAIAETSNTVQSAAKQSTVLGGVLSGALTAGAVAAGAAIAGVGVALGALAALAKRGAGLEDIAGSFQILSKSIGGTTDQLKALRKGAAGTMSDMDLMQRANLALMGTEGALAQQFAAAMPKLLEIARVQANATGQSVTDVFDALIMAIKEAQPRLLNHTGIVIKSNLAMDAYAASIGKSTNELTLEEQQLAALNAVMLAGSDTLTKYGGLTESADEKMARLGSTVSNILDKLAVAVQPAFKKILDALQPIFNFLERLATAAAPYIAAIANLFAQLVASILGPIGKGLSKLSAPEVVRGFFEGGARLIGALAGGMASAANAVIQVVTMLAKVIASFLSGFSPPPEGPLSTIDKGGANIIKAWLAGMAGVSLDPVEKVAGQVASLMGNIADYSREQVTARFADLDTALQPFQDRLDLVKAQFEALKPVTDAAFSSIDRQMERALEALNRGDAGAAATVRQLDNQRTALEDYAAAQQDQIDAAQVQLALMQAQQAQERAALEIRRRMLGEAPSPGNLIEPGPGGEPIGPGENPLAPGVPGAGGNAPGGLGDFTAGIGKAGDVIDTFSQDVARAMADIKTSFNEGFTSAGGNIKDLEKNFGDLQKVWDDVKEKAGGIVTKIENAWEGIKTWITDVLAPNLQAGWDIIKTNAETIWTDIRTTVENAWTTLRDNVENTWNYLRGNLETGWSEFQTWITTTIGNIQTTINNTWKAILDWIDITLGNIQKTIEGTWSDIQTFVTTTIGNIQTTIQRIWTDITTWLNNRVGEIRTTFTNIGNAITGALQGVWTFLNNIWTIIQQITTWNPPSWMTPGSPTSPFSPNYPGGGSTGDFYGVHSPGTYVVGTGAQPQLFTTAKSMLGIPNIDQVLSNVASNMFAQPMPALVGAGTSSNDNRSWDQSEQSIVFNGVSSTNDALRRYAILRALGRVR